MSARKKPTGAVAQIKQGDISSIPVGGVAQIMQGKAAGVAITQATGAPGENIAVRIRGVDTINDNYPLYIILAVYRFGQLPHAGRPDSELVLRPVQPAHGPEQHLVEIRENQHQPQSQSVVLQNPAGRHLRRRFRQRQPGGQHRALRLVPDAGHTGLQRPGRVRRFAAGRW
ncbi:hypothetical protein E5J99_12030 [Hymenobacter elongatus]|uniref:Uncharacterized protein n=1 Tax=Hymenobacter elongatus TaxID=877208 RepID=A0A4Z0PJI2_9BACT|nr:hypothetical protein E5J99_12030 [Hymenobacter elongatus]